MDVIKRVLAMALALLIAIGSIPISSYGESVKWEEQYIDFPNNWSTPWLVKALENGMITGYSGRIMPNDYLTRAQMAVIVSNAFGATERASLGTYIDMPIGAWFYEHMARAVHMKVIVGNANRLSPEVFITREQAFAVLANAFELSSDQFDILNNYFDGEKVSPWAKSSVSAMLQSGYVVGSGGYIQPKKNITRAEFSALIGTMIGKIITTAGTYEEDVNGNLLVRAKGVTLKNMTIEGDLIVTEGVGEGEVILENVTIKGRTVVRGKGQLIAGDVELDDVALGTVTPPQGTNPPASQPEAANPDTGGSGNNNNTSSLYQFQLIKDGVSVILFEETYSNTKVLNFEYINQSFTEKKETIKVLLGQRSNWIQTALAMTSSKSGKSYAFTIASRVASYTGDPLTIFGNPMYAPILKTVLEGNEPSSEQINLITALLLDESLRSMLDDFKKLYSNADDVLPEGFGIEVYDGTSLKPIADRRISYLEETIESALGGRTFESMNGKEAIKITFAGKSVILKLVKFSGN